MKYNNWFGEVILQIYVKNFFLDFSEYMQI